MSNRSLIRGVAKARLEALGVKKVNRKFGMTIPKGLVRKFQKHRGGRKMLIKLRRKYVPLWRRVMTGKLGEKGRMAQLI